MQLYASFRLLKVHIPCPWGVLAIAMFRECWDLSAVDESIAIYASWSVLHRLYFEPGQKSTEVSEHAFGQRTAEWSLISAVLLSCQILTKSKCVGNWYL